MSTEIRSAREAITIFKILGIKEITTERQRKNGTQVFELPIQQMWATLNPKPLRFAIYSTGYVRNISESNSSCYQINKTKKYLPLNEYQHGYTERILIPKWEDRLIYLAKFIIKNYYRKTTNIISDTSLDYIRQELRKPVETAPEVKVIVNGHRYNIC